MFNLCADLGKCPLLLSPICRWRKWSIGSSHTQLIRGRVGIWTTCWVTQPLTHTGDKEKLDCLVMSPYQTLQVQGDDGVLSGWMLLSYSLAKYWEHTELRTHRTKDTQSQGHIKPRKHRNKERNIEHHKILEEVHRTSLRSLACWWRSWVGYCSSPVLLPPCQGEEYRTSQWASSLQHHWTAGVSEKEMRCVGALDTLRWPNPRLS